jgi:regulator of nonsense transcripts 1
MSFQASQGGYGVEYVTQGSQGAYSSDFMNQNSQGGYQHGSTGNDFISQDFIAHGSQGLFTQVGFSDRTQYGPSTQTHYGLGGPLQSQGIMGPLYSQPFTQYSQPLTQQQQPQQQNSQHQRRHYNG